MLRLRLPDRHALIQLHKTLSECFLYNTADDRTSNHQIVRINHSSRNRQIGLFLIDVISKHLQEDYSFTPQRPLINPAHIIKIEPVDIEGLHVDELTLVHTTSQSYLIHENLDYTHDEIRRFRR